MDARLPPGPDPTSRAALRQLFLRHGFRPRRSLGQTFLVDRNIVAKIVEAAQLTGREPVLEVGPGAGAVTRALVMAAARVVAIEIDPVLVAVLQETVGEAAEVIQGDVLAADWDRLLGGSEEGWVAAANLPYAITGPALLHLLSAQDRLRRLVVMVQAEVAQRLLAPPGSRTRGLLTVMAEAACEVKLAWRVARTCFWPAPRVDSTVLALQVRQPPTVPPELRERFFRVARAGFGVRRKTIQNALAYTPELGLTKQQAAVILDACEIPPARRAEELGVADFLRLAQALRASRAEAAP